MRDTTLDLPDDRERVQGPADVLGGGDLDDAHEAELDVDVDDRAVCGERERHVRVALPVLVERFGRRVVVLAGQVDWPVGDERGDLDAFARRRVAHDAALEDEVGAVGARPAAENGDGAYEELFAHR